MGYDISVFGAEGEVVSTLTTFYDDHRAAHALMGALGVEYESTDTEGEGDCYNFTYSELSAAQEALIVAVNVDQEFTRGLILLADAMNYMVEHEVADIEIGFF